MVFANVGGAGLAAIASISRRCCGDALLDRRHEVLRLDLGERRHAERRRPGLEQRVGVGRRRRGLLGGEDDRNASASRTVSAVRMNMASAFRVETAARTRARAPARPEAAIYRAAARRSTWPACSARAGTT